MKRGMLFIEYIHKIDLCYILPLIYTYESRENLILIIIVIKENTYHS